MERYGPEKIPYLDTFHAVRIYLTLLSTTVKIHQISYVIFETISHFWRHNLSVFFLAQTLHTFDRNIPSKCTFSDFPLLELKFTKLFKQKVSFSSKFGSLFSVTRDNSSALFSLKLYMLLTNIAHQSAIFSDLSLFMLKFTKFLMSFLESRASFTSNFASLISAMRDNFFLLFHLKLYMFSPKETHQSANYQDF